MHISCDIETASEVDLRKHGSDIYARHPSTRILMIAYSIDGAPVKVWDATDGSPMPRDLRAAFDDPISIWHAFNAEFERGLIREVWHIDVPPERWWCTMIRAYQQSFAGTLGQIGGYVGLPDHLQKDKEGDRLIRLFCMPQKVTKNQPYVWRDSLTDPVDWQKFLGYCVQDVVAESEILRRLDKFPSPMVEQTYYALNCRKNDAGIPIDRKFVENGIVMAARRKAELTVELKALTGLANPNSPSQLTAWLGERGFPFGDINKNTVKKVLDEHRDDIRVMTNEVVSALKIRQQVARTSVKKFDAILDRAYDDDFMRHAFQFAGASRTNRASGRGAQPHNFPRPPGFLEDDALLDEVTDTVRRGDYDWLSLLAAEPLDAIVGVIRSSFRAPEGKEWVVSDLSSIESVVFGYLARDEKILTIAREKLDPYKAFAVEWFKVPYGEVNKDQRKVSKVPVLGCAYGMGGGGLREGKRTGLWAYSESMGIPMTQDQAQDAVKVWRGTYTAGVQFWYDLDRAITTTIKTGTPTTVGVCRIDLMKPYLRIRLPTGRFIYYHLPRVTIERGHWPNGDPYAKETISYMGKDQITGRWQRIYSRGAKFAENITQALAREILYIGMARAAEAGFDLRIDVHDELGALRDIGDERYSLDLLRKCMTDPIDSLPGIPLRAAGWVGPYYKKD